MNGKIKSKRLMLKSMEVTLGLSKIDDIVDYDMRGIIREGVSEMEENMGEMVKMIKSLTYEMKLSCLKFYENAANLAEAENGPYFTQKQFQDAIMRMMNGNPLNMMALIKTNDVIKN